MPSIHDVRKSRGRPAVNAVPVTVRIPPDQLAAIDAWAGRQTDAPSRPEALRRLAAIALDR